MPRFSFAHAAALLVVVPTLIAASPLRLPQRDSTLQCPDADGQTVQVDTSSFLITCDYDYLGNNLGNLVWTSDFEDCLSTCDNTTGCAGVSYNGGACWPKSSTDGDFVATTGVWAAKKVVPPVSCPDSDGNDYTATDGTVYTIECSVDRYGNDIPMTWESSFGDCIESCETTDGCVDVSYISGTPGPCYLKNTVGAGSSDSSVWGAIKKSAIPTPTPTPTPSSTAAPTPTATPSVCTNGFTTEALSCPAADGLCYVDATGAIYELECSKDRYGGDLSMSWESSLESCIATCSSTAGCIDVSYVPGTPGPCYMKSTAGEPQSNDGVWGALLVSGSSSTTTSSSAAAGSISSSAAASSTSSSAAASSTSSSDVASSTSSAAASSAVVSTTTSTTSATLTATNLITNGDFNTGNLAGWTVSVLQNTGTSDEPIVGTSDSPTNSPHFIFTMNTPSGEDSSMLTMRQTISAAQANTWYKVTFSYMMESTGPFASGSDCYIFGQTSNGQFFHQYAPSMPYYANTDATNTCSMTQVGQPVPASGEWVTVSAYMQFADSKTEVYSPTTHRYVLTDSGVLDTTFYIEAACGEGISNTIHIDNIIMEMATC
ncbi:uncharacterized protein BDZ99DRAFT_575409 [Mytilinidion resinicola]|uniref:Apple domain-containing protein n=1 Tax=Mytilinidion resinicola TaxID=574789 RepID=A0A6A6Y7A5_9PEZI|nr:uncharacterized protein BDZ99DRAFT_575409 [Mytilinidion resinicola]KAF2804413.1 hypothetical protein BDZ99DRAFT_575409 [Mytilinidion resinicola]